MFLGDFITPYSKCLNESLKWQWNHRENINSNLLNEKLYSIELTSPEIVVFTVRNTMSGATQIKTKAIKIIDWYKLHFELLFSCAACILKQKNIFILLKISI